MRQLTILSGKGGTGKTTLAASFAVLAKNAVVADCDVDAPDLQLLLHPTVLAEKTFRVGKTAIIDPTKCTKCGLCQKHCRFDAITDQLRVDGNACEGCGVCAVVCAVGAVALVDHVSGCVYLSKTKHGFMSHALLSPGESNSGKLVTQVRQNAKLLAESEHANTIIIDGSPGVGCPVIASVSGVDAALIVTEPTLSGIHDLKRVLRLLNHFGVHPYICVNMYDINIDVTEEIEGFCKQNHLEVVGAIPFNSKVTEAMVEGKTVVEYAPASDVAQEIETVFGVLIKKGVIC